jgi:hypothetical protein
MMESELPGAGPAWIGIDPTGWSAHVNALTDGQRKHLMELLAQYGNDMPDV